MLIRKSENSCQLHSSHFNHPKVSQGIPRYHRYHWISIISKSSIKTFWAPCPMSPAKNHQVDFRRHHLTHLTPGGGHQEKICHLQRRMEGSQPMVFLLHQKAWWSYTGDAASDSGGIHKSISIMSLCILSILVRWFSEVAWLEMWKSKSGPPDAAVHLCPFHAFCPNKHTIFTVSRCPKTKTETKQALAINEEAG